MRPHLESANQIWCPYKIRDIDALEKVQRRATKLIPTLRELSYQERLRKLKLPTLAYRRSRGDMIETFKIIQGIYDKQCCEEIFEVREETCTRGHNKKIFKKSAILNIRKYSFCRRVVNMWNNLPIWVIDSENVLKFEKNLDNVWCDQEQRYEYRAEIKHSRIDHPSEHPTDGGDLELVSQAS